MKYKPVTKILTNCIRKYVPVSPPLSPKAEKYIASLFYEINHAHKAWKSVKQEILSTKQESMEIYKPKPETYNYIPGEIREKIERDCQSYTHYLYSFTIISRVFNIHLMCTDHIQKIERIHLWFQIACKQNPDLGCSKNINIYLYCIDFPKLFPHEIEIGTIHANTAFTTGCQSSTDIVIFREEEWFKVLMHESFHNLGLDFLNSNVSDHKLREMFNIEHVHDIRFYETYCEMCAEMMNIVFVVYYINSTRATRATRVIRDNKTIKNTKRKVLREFKRMMVYESIFSCFQCAKIMRHNKIHYSDFINPRTSYTDYTENTYVFSYYILKSILFFDFPSFIDFVQTQGSLKFNSNLGHKYIDLISKNYKNPVYLQRMSLMESISNATCKNTLRMTMFELM